MPVLRFGALAPLLLLGCHRRPAATPNHARTSPEPRRVLRASPPGVVRSTRTSLELTLPSRSHWQVDDEHERWLVARQPVTHSVLRLRTWVAPRTTRPDDCERQARLWDPKIPRSDEESVVTKGPLRAPPDVVGDVIVSVVPAPGETIEGAAVGFGASVGRCYAVVFTTQERGSAAEARLARRLELIVDHVLPTVKILRVEDRGSGPTPDRF